MKGFKIKKEKIFISLAGIVIVIFTLWSTQVYSYICSGTTWKTSEANFKVDTTDGPAYTLGAIRIAMDMWNEVNTSSFEFDYAGTPSYSPWGFDGENTLTFEDLESQLGQTHWWYTQESGTYYTLEADIVLDSDPFPGYPWTFDRLKAVTAHELGHVLGLNHSADSEAIMWSEISDSNQILRSDDIDGISYLYPSDESFLGDFDGDGDADILWRHSTTGMVYIWLMNGKARTTSGSPGTESDLEVRIQGIGDLDGDGDDDIIWRNVSTGTVSAWLMNGTALEDSGTVGTETTDWQIKGIGPLNSTEAAFVRSNGSTGTSTTLDIGTPGTNRLVVVFADDESKGAALTGVTVDGKACHLVATAINTSGAGNHQEMWYADEDDLGVSSGVVTIAIQGGDAGWGVHAHLYTGIAQDGFTDSGIDDTSVGISTITVTGIDVPAGGIVVMGAGEGTGGLTVNNWTSPLTERQDGPDPASADLFSASDIETTAQTNKTYVATLSGNHNRGAGIVASWDFGEYNYEREDILWRNMNTGEVKVWQIGSDGLSVESSGSPGTKTLDWCIKGIAQFDNNERLDILWQNGDTGEVEIWLMDGTSLDSSASPATVSDSNWYIKGVVDFDNDSQVDILWRHSETGMVYIWLMNGTARKNSGSPATVSSSNWHIKGTADFNNDGNKDILWCNSKSGMVYIWLMNGTTRITSGSPATVKDLGWKIK